MSDVVEQVLALSRADGCVVVLSESSRADLRWAGNTLTTNGAVRGRSLTVISIVGASVGIRSATVVDDLHALVRASEQAAKEATAADDAGPLVQGPAQPDFSEAAEQVAADVFGDLARGLGRAFGDARTSGMSLYGYASHDLTTTWLGSSTGLRLRHAQPTGYVEVTGKGAGGSSWVGQHTRDWSDISVPRLDAELRRRLGWGARSVELPAGRYETILPPSAVSDLLGYAYWSASGRDAAEGRTVFGTPGGGTRLGEHLGPAGLRLWSDPHDPALATAPFAVATSSSSMSSVFDNGMALPSTDWLRDGALQNLITTRATARGTGLPYAPYVHSLSMDAGGTGTTDDLVARTERGLLLTCMWYIREVDPETLLLTGLTRDGVYLVEDGAVTARVNNFRWNESPIGLLGRIAEVGASVATLPREWSDDLTWVRMPPVRIPDFNMSSVSQAE